MSAPLIALNLRINFWFHLNHIYTTFAQCLTPSPDSLSTLPRPQIDPRSLISTLTSLTTLFPMILVSLEAKTANKMALILTISLESLDGEVRDWFLYRHVSTGGLVQGHENQPSLLFIHHVY